MTCYRSFYIRDQKGDPLEVPCGMCIGCRLEKARQWAVRCVHESQMHERNCFVTLTYNNSNLPDDHSLDKSAIPKFLKRLRNHFSSSIRYYGCGEYGDNKGGVVYKTGLGRPHYHLCLFGIDFDDKELIRGSNYVRWQNHFSKGGVNDLFISPTLSKKWPYGFHSIGDLSFDSAGYVARYCMKKVTGKNSKVHYGTAVPEFALMSRMPGIGKSWIEKYFHDVYPKDFFHINGVKNKPPRYYDDYASWRSPNMFNALKADRIEKAKENEETPERKFDKEKHKTFIIKPLIRSL